MTNGIPNILTQIITQKKIEVALKKLKYTEAELIADSKHKPYDFTQALRDKIKLQQPAIIAEIKKASPSQGIIRHNFDPIQLAHQYESAGAACLSILTDESFFKGSNHDLEQVRKVSKLPLLRKEFIIDSYQIYEAKALGADCILLIVAVLDDIQLKDFYDLASNLDLQVLVESHDVAELERALRLPTPLIGINNRDLRNFVTDINTTLRLKAQVPEDRLIVTESGIASVQDIKLMQQHGVNCFLIGETFLKEPQPEEILAQFMLTKM